MCHKMTFQQNLWNDIKAPSAYLQIDINLHLCRQMPQSVTLLITHKYTTALLCKASQQ